MIGDSPTRTDGAAKVTGRALYVDDIPFDGVLCGKTVRSTVARGRLRGITFRPGVPWDEFVIVTAKDIPGKNTVTLIESDQPYLADGEIRHVAEPVVLLAHADKGLLEKAARLVELDIQPLPAVFTIDESAAAAASGDAQYGSDNMFKRFRIARGDAARALERARSPGRGHVRNRRAGAALHRTAGRGGDRHRPPRASRCGVRFSAPTTSTRRSAPCWDFRRKKCASFRRSLAAASAARRSTRT